MKVFFDSSTGIVAESLALGNAAANFSTEKAAVPGCQAQLPSGETIQPTSFPAVGQQSAAYAMNTGFVQADFVIFQQGTYFGAVVLAQSGTPDASLLTTLVQKAVARLPVH